jgi:hypothetical protein
MTPHNYIGYVTSKDDSEWSGNVVEGSYCDLLELTIREQQTNSFMSAINKLQDHIGMQIYSEYIFCSFYVLYFDIPFFLLVVCSENSCLSERYHVGLWSGKRWTCCRLSNRSADGCDSCTSWSRTSTTLGLNKNESVESINNNPAALNRLAGKIFAWIPEL